MYLVKNMSMEDKSKVNEQYLEILPTPVEGDKGGEYYIDLRTVMEHNEKVTSKQVLLPFFHNISFTKLEVICTHVPPWFEDEFLKLNLRSEVEAISENEVRIIVSSI